MALIDASGPVNDLLARQSLFGSGEDGALEVDNATVNYTGRKQYTSVTLINFGYLEPTDNRFATLYVSGTLSIESGSQWAADWDAAGRSGGASRNTVGVGNMGDGIATWHINDVVIDKIAGRSGRGAGGGGGGVTNRGGHGGPAIATQAYEYGVIAQDNGQVGNGDNGADTSTITPFANNDLGYYDVAAWVGLSGAGGGGGGIDSIGTGATTGTSGKGGNGGFGGGYLHGRIYRIEVESAGGINANARDGYDGDDATDSTNTDADCGGGGGGAGGGGGCVRILCGFIDNPGNAQANGGTGGSGGNGVGGGGNGGDGGDGADGIVAITEILG